MSIRLRLTLLYTGILVLTLVAFGGALYVAQSRYTLGLVARDLDKFARQAALGLERIYFEYGELMPPAWVERREDPERGAEGQALFPVMRDARARDMLNLLDPQGEPLDIPTNRDDAIVPVNSVALEQLRDGEVWVEIAHDAEGRLFVHHQPAIVEGQLVAIVQVARSLADLDRALRSLGVALLLGTAATTLVAFGVGWTLAGVTLRPIHQITQAAREIGQARDFASRVEHAGPNDELGRLATTFNEMLAQLETGYRQVTHALGVQRDFVADVSHELRTPLTTIRGNLALLQREPPLPDAERADVLADLAGESERLSRLVADLLVLARADAGRALDGEAVALVPLVEEVCRQARLLAPQREIAWDVGEALVANANEDALKQVLLILLDNAIKHGHGTIEVTARAREGQVGIDVRDRGPGIAPALQARIFDRFYRGDASRSTPGFGLGLSIARALVEAQQGHIEVASLPGEGSIFSVWLPKALDPSKA